MIPRGRHASRTRGVDSRGFAGPFRGVLTRHSSCSLRISAVSATMAISSSHAEPLMPEAYQGASPNARFLVGELPTKPNDSVRLGNAFSVSFVTHAVVVL